MLPCWIASDWGNAVWGLVLLVVAFSRKSQTWSVTVGEGQTKSGWKMRQLHFHHCPSWKIQWKGQASHFDWPGLMHSTEKWDLNCAKTHCPFELLALWNSKMNKQGDGLSLIEHNILFDWLSVLWWNVLLAWQKIILGRGLQNMRHHSRQMFLKFEHLSVKSFVGVVERNKRPEERKRKKREKQNIHHPSIKNVVIHRPRRWTQWKCVDGYAGGN